ncbi:Conserved_hypothetical protein [Hexamita inflata]|uniref:Uncharacterized protein n=1 Tax=Hexamita inflata TaxID=28002 RepID=A0ABP1IKA8_9EUKA
MQDDFNPTLDDPADLSKQLYKTDQLTLSNAEKLETIETQIDTKFTEIDTKFTEIDTKFAEIVTKFTAIDTKFTAIDTKFAAIDKQIADVVKEMKNIGTTANISEIQNQIRTLLSHSTL